MEIIISGTKAELGSKAARSGAELINKAIIKKGVANIILATGASQFEMLSSLVKEEVDWSKVRAFHLDEYIGLPETHPASFRKYLKERFSNIVSPLEFILINGENDPGLECTRVGKLINKYRIDVAFVGIGENGHLAFNDPPADFETEEAYIVVHLNRECRMQQMGEGWFKSYEEVPERAISMSIKQILKAEAIICTVPDKRKAVAVKETIGGKISEMNPASVLRNHKDVKLFLDMDSSSLLS